MKKLKIFLLLSILLCFGFVLSSEVHAEGDGPKIFEVGDVLPASLIAIYGEVEEEESVVITFNNNYIQLDNISGYSLNTDFPYSNKSGNFMIIDLSLVSPSDREVVDVLDNFGFLEWEDLNAPSAKKFEEGDILPAGNIKIWWDFTGKPIIEEYETFFVSSGDDYFNDFIIRINFNGSSNKTIEIFNGGSVEHFNADTPGFTIITLTEPVTITDLKDSAGPPSHDYNVYVDDALTWEVVSQDYLNGFMEARGIYGFRYMGGPWMSGEAAWNHGYDKGSEQAWDEGYEYGMEIYGYFDPITDQWLSVSGYLELYGTDKPGQSDFYGNFDKYFIPAMIIVFGGAIVLTILKVFKGRE